MGSRFHRRAGAVKWLDLDRVTLVLDIPKYNARIEERFAALDAVQRACGNSLFNRRC